MPNKNVADWVKRMLIRGFLVGAIALALLASVRAEQSFLNERDPVLKEFYEGMLITIGNSQGKLQYEDTGNQINLTKLTKQISKILPLVQVLDRKKEFVVSRYMADSYTSASDLFVPISKQGFWYLLRPGDAVLLSDGHTAHYSTVYAVDRQFETVDFLDHWPDRIFLLAELNNAGVIAQLITGPQQSKLVRITRNEFEQVILGLSSVDSTDVIDDFFEIFPDAERNASVRLAFGMQLLEAADAHQPTLFEDAVVHLETAYHLTQKLNGLDSLDDFSFHVAAMLYQALVRGSFYAVHHLQKEGDNKLLLAWERKHRTLQNELLKRYGDKQLLGHLDVNQSFKVAMAAQIIRQYKAAIGCFARVIELDPLNVEALIGRGEAYMAIRAHDLTLKDSTRALEILDKRITQYNRREDTTNVGRVLDQLGESQAIATLRKRVLWLHAQGLLAIGKTNESKKFGKLLIELHHDWYGGYFIVAQAFKKESNFPEARNYIDQALEREKDSNNRSALMKMKADVQ